MMRKLSTLKPNPLSVAIYGDEGVDALLAESIRANGVLVPLTVRADGVIVSGHRRFHAAYAAGLERVPVVVVAFDDELAERLAIIEHNRQREKTATQRQRELEEKEKIEKEKAKERQTAGLKRGNEMPVQENFPERDAGQARDKLAAGSGMTGRTLAKEKYVYEQAKKAMPEAVKQMKRLDEGASVHSAYTKVREAEKEQERDELRKQAEKAAPAKCSNVIVGDFREVADQVGDGTVSLIFTDPPYDREASEMLPDLAAFAERKLAEGGSLLCYVGQTQLPAAMDAFRARRLRYWWTVACVHGGAANLMNKYGVRAGWKPVLWFVKGTRHELSNIVSDVMSGGQEKERHRWQQAEGEAEYWIEKLCPADGLVCDPFLGSGTTAVAAERLKRRWVGIEIDAATAAGATERINNDA